MADGADGVKVIIEKVASSQKTSVILMNQSKFHLFAATDVVSSYRYGEEVPCSTKISVEAELWQIYGGCVRKSMNC